MNQQNLPRTILGWLCLLGFVLSIFAAYREPSSPKSENDFHLFYCVALAMFAALVIAPIAMITNTNPPIPFSGIVATWSIISLIDSFINTGSVLPKDAYRFITHFGWPIIYSIDFILWWLIPRIKNNQSIIHNTDGDVIEAEARDV